MKERIPSKRLEYSETFYDSGRTLYKTYSLHFLTLYTDVELLYVTQSIPGEKMMDMLGKPGGGPYW